MNNLKYCGPKGYKPEELEVVFSHCIARYVCPHGAECKYKNCQCAHPNVSGSIVAHPKWCTQGTVQSCNNARCAFNHHIKEKDYKKWRDGGTDKRAGDHNDTIVITTKKTKNKKTKKQIAVKEEEEEILEFWPTPAEQSKPTELLPAEAFEQKIFNAEMFDIMISEVDDEAPRLWTSQAIYSDPVLDLEIDVRELRIADMSDEDEEWPYWQDTIREVADERRRAEEERRRSEEERINNMVIPIMHHPMPLNAAMMLMNYQPMLFPMMPLPMMSTARVEALGDAVQLETPSTSA